MKALRWAALGCLALALALGLWLLIRRPGPRIQAEDPGSSFKVQPANAGFLIEYVEDQVPLRAIAWVQGRQPGLLFAQVLTQNDRQRVSVFRQGQQVATLTVPRPPEVTEGFFRFAELKDAVLIEGRGLLLLFGQGHGGRDEESLVMFLDLDALRPPWAHRCTGNRIVHEPLLDTDGVYVFGGIAPPLRIHIPDSGKGGRPAAEAIDLPAEVDGVSCLLPTGPGTFLAAHARGLSAFRGKKGWLHHPLPEAGQLKFNTAGQALAATKGNCWWQPFPGRLIQVDRNGEAKGEATLGDSLKGGSLGLDAGMLSLLGADPNGGLWFGLLAPLLPNPAPAPPGDPAKATPPGDATAPEPPPVPPGPTADLPSEERARWEVHLAGGLSRVYRWTQEKATLRVYRWAPCWEALGRPAGLPAPTGTGHLNPGSGGIFAGAERRVVWVPFSALGPGEDPNQPK